jgi:uncharacterized lipoprotein NlpE involved in copper resistance
VAFRRQGALGCSSKRNDPPGKPVAFGRFRRGITLLELMLSLALTGVVMIVISMAIDLNLRTLDVRRADVEQAQLARAVLRHIAADLRCAVVYEPLDMTSVQQMGASAASSGTEQGTAGSAEGASGTSDQTKGSTSGQTSGQTTGRTSGQTTGGTNSPTDSSDTTSGLDDMTDLGLDEAVSENTVDIASSAAPTSTPGLFGNQYELRVDVSRLPRVDQYQPTATPNGDTATWSVPSDVKSVSYYLQTSDQPQSTAATGQTMVNGAGLVRREVDRAVASYSAQDGSLESSDQSGNLFAREVNYLEFRYFDGTQWCTEWDSEQMGGLPLAIEITVGIDPTAGSSEEDLQATAVSDAVANQSTDYIYRLVVHLPMARPLTVTESTDTTSMMEDGQ